MATTNAESALLRWDALAALPTEAQSALAAAAELRRFEAGETVFTMGQNDGSVVYALAEGLARLTTADGERGDVSVEEVEGCRFFGLGGFALGDATMTGAALHAVSQVVMLSFDALALRALCLRDGSVAWAFLRLTAEVQRNKKRAASDPRARVYRHLLTMVRRGPGGLEIPEMPRHAALAEASGVSDVDAASAVAELIGQGIAKRSYPGLQVVDGDALNRVAYD